ncbi:sulfotransferase domain-containing protein [Saccharothrix sp. AJ9571]|nr:sulfotransferase domain-containing protein [Saccharothrix sp. AJ9571]
MAKAPRAMVISLQKAGTHLMQGLMVELGYKMAGVPRPDPGNVPVFDDEQRRRIAALTLSKLDYDELLACQGTPEFAERTQAAWAALGWSWQNRLGQRVVTRYGQTRQDHAENLITNPDIAYSRFSETPPGLCWIFHELDVNKVDGNFLSEWADTGNPRLVFNYRDPRDTLVSMINFLEGRTRAGYGNFYEFDIFSRILASKPTWEEKIDYAIADESFLGWDQYRKSLWLLHHPDVCKVSYEDLVGPDGGGSRERQVGALDRLLRHIDSPLDAEEVAAKVYNPDSWSFFRGKTGTWRERFTDRNLAHFNEVFGDTLAQFGYE